MNYLYDIKRVDLTDNNGIKDRLKDYMLKISTTKLCLVDLDDFCNNKVNF